MSETFEPPFVDERQQPLFELDSPAAPAQLAEEEAPTRGPLDTWEETEEDEGRHLEVPGPEEEEAARAAVLGHLEAAPADRTHRVHAVKSGGTRVDVGGAAFRFEAGANVTREQKEAHARRLVVAWNVCEGFRTEDLEAGVLLEVSEAADALVLALREVALPSAAGSALERLRGALSRADRCVDLSHGRLHDCANCLSKSQ